MKDQKIISLNPGKNYEIIGEVAITTNNVIDNKIAKARSAQKIWAALKIEERINFLEKIYQALKKRKDEIKSIAAKEMGMPVSVSSLIDIEPGLNYMRGYLDFAAKWLAPEITYENKNEIHYIFFEPKGVAGISIPWNYPFLLFIWSVMQNLIVGNTVVFKHSEECILTGKLLADIINSTDLPDGVFNAVYGNGPDVGEYLMNSNIDLIWFTGSTRVGNHLYKIAAKKLIPAILELGGSAPGIVFEDADIDKAVESIYFNRYINSGQSCDALKRLIVHKNIFNKIIQRLKELILTKKIGYAEDPDTDLGPLVSEKQVISLENQVADAIKKGAKVIMGARRPDNLKGAYYEPTILTNITFDMKVWNEEVFGPVLPVVPFRDEEEAIALANDTIYGLGGFVYTQDKDRALRISKFLQTGNISVNGTSYVIAQNPFGGYKKSGFSREHGKEGLRELCSIKSIAMNK